MIKNGSLVKLKSDGPIMTVIEKDETGQCNCVWWNLSEKRYNFQNFVEVILVEVASRIEVYEVIKEKEKQILEKLNLNELRALGLNDEIS